MINNELLFVKKLIEDQLNAIKSETVVNFNMVASGLFENQWFCDFIIEIYGLDYFRETKTEWECLSKDMIVDDMEKMISTIIEKTR